MRLRRPTTTAKNTNPEITVTIPCIVNTKPLEKDSEVVVLKAAAPKKVVEKRVMPCLQAKQSKAQKVTS